MKFLEKYLIKRINDNFAGYEYMFCEKLYSDIMFMPDSVRTCCFSTKMPYNPPKLFYKPASGFNKLSYLYKIYKIMKQNQTEDAVCKGCKFFKKQTVPMFSGEKNINFLTINHFTKCNCSCVYCVYGDYVNKTDKTPNKILPVIKKMFDKNMINECCLINWGGGEPTIYPEFEQLAAFFRQNKIHQAVNSSGVVFSKEISDGMKDNSMSIQISPDAGTAQTYAMIKRVDKFDIVWSNIAKYALFPDMLFVKYIFFSLNSDENEVRKFIEKCIETGVKNIVIDCESSSANDENCKFGRITEETVNLAILMKNLAIENNLNYQISYQWRSEHREMIEQG